MRGMRFFIFVGLAVAAPTKPAFAAAADNGLSADQLLELKLAQSESLETLDATMETAVESVGDTAAAKKPPLQIRMQMDKVRGAMRLSHLTADGTANAEFLVQGTQVSYKDTFGKWQSQEIDDQTRATLEALGVDFKSLPSAKQGLGGQAKHSGHASGKTKAARLQERLQKVAKLKEAFSFQVLDDDASVGLPQGLDQAPLAESDAARSGHHLKGMMRRQKKTAGDPGIDAQVEWIDETSGAVVESSQWVTAARRDLLLGQAGKKAKQGGIQWRKVRTANGDELVEINRSRTKKMVAVNGVALPEESETVSDTAVGEVRQTVRWSNMKANEAMDQRTFEKN
jgi:hypothetical protein